MKDNWYLILELDFDPAEKNPEVINKRIKEKVAYWNKRKTMPVDDARECERLAKKHKEIVADMSNEAKRSQMATEAVTEISGKVDPRIKQIGKDGFISDEQIKQIANVMEIPLALVKKRCDQLGVKIGENPLQALYKRYTDFDADKKMKFDMKLNKDLVAFKTDGFDGLYGFLFSDAESNIIKERLYSISQLKDKATGANSRANDFNSMHSDNPQKAAGANLSKICADVFKGEESRKEYDQYLLSTRLDKVFGDINIFRGSEIVSEDVNKYISSITGIIGSSIEAEQIFKHHCSINGIGYVRAEKKDEKEEIFESIRRAGSSGSLMQKQADGFVTQLAPLYGGNKSKAQSEFDGFCSRNGIRIEVPVTPPTPFDGSGGYRPPPAPTPAYAKKPMSVGAKGAIAVAAIVVVIIGFNLFGGGDDEHTPVVGNTQPVQQQTPNVAQPPVAATAPNPTQQPTTTPPPATPAPTPEPTPTPEPVQSFGDLVGLWIAYSPTGNGWADSGIRWDFRRDGIWVRINENNQGTRVYGTWVLDSLDNLTLRAENFGWENNTRVHTVRWDDANRVYVTISGTIDPALILIR